MDKLFLHFAQHPFSSLESLWIDIFIHIDICILTSGLNSSEMNKNIP